MAVSKQYDEMADRYTYFGDIQTLINKKSGFGVVRVRPAFVDLKDGGDVFWIVFYRKGFDWYWINRNDFIVLADGQRFTGFAEVAESKVTEEMGWFGTDIMCNEELHCGASKDIMETIGKSKSVKIRLGDVDMEMPNSFMTDIKEILADIESTGGYGSD